MGVEIAIKTTISHNGEDITGPLVKAFNHVTVTCDNPNCQRGGFDPEMRKRRIKVVEWDEGTPGEVPEDFYPILSLEDTHGGKKAFCCKGCLSSYLLGYQQVKAPNQQNVIEFPGSGETQPAETTGVFA